MVLQAFFVFPCKIQVVTPKGAVQTQGAKEII
jgi:hypothetical protein